VPIPDDYTRARIRCPECGVMCDVPASAQKPSGGAPPRRPAPSAETDAVVEDILLGNDAPPPAAEEKPRKQKPTAAVQAERPRAAGPLHPLPPSPNERATDADDGQPYRVPSLDEERPCPECRRTIARDAVLCTFCGYNLETGQQAKQEYEPVERQWHGGWPVNVRRGLFIGAEALFVLAVIVSVTAGAPFCGALCPWILFTAMTAFLLGTYDHLHLTRNKKGRVRLTKSWTVCFIPRQPQKVDVNDYGGVAYGPVDETSILEWLVLIVLIFAGIIPGLIWLYFVFIRTSFQVGLTKEHGYLDLVLYRGSNEKMVLDVAETVRDVAHLPCSKN
jgi:hypothetical protein